MTSVNVPTGQVAGGIDSQYPDGAHPADNGIAQSGFKITTRKLPILKAGPIEEMNDRLGIAVPEMIFGDNFVRIEHPESGWGIEFNAFDALDRVDKTGESMLQVAHSREWHAGRQQSTSDIKEVVKPFDWSYTTDYTGTDRSTGTSSAPTFQPTSIPIPLELLKRPDPILFFDDVTLYEDELADNGIALLHCKIRVMPERMLLLTRFFMRLDDVLFRIRDTRIFVEFGTGDVLKEYTLREQNYKDVKRHVIGMGNTEPEALAIMRDANQLSPYLPVVGKSLEGLGVK